MKKLAILVSLILAVGSFAFAETYVSANDVEKGTYTDVKKLEDGFALNGTADKPVEVTKVGEEKAEYNGEVFTQRFKLGGSGSTTARNISFSAKKGQVVTILGLSSSKTDTRSIAVADTQGQVVGSVDVAPAAGAVPLSVGTVKIPADGDYFVYSKKSGIYIYTIVVK